MSETPTNPGDSAYLQLRNVRKTYAGQAAVEDFSFDFREGETTAILGPSGSGKSTLLWMIAGLCKPDAGRILLQGRAITALPAEKREMGLVFQSYALFPHLSVRENVEFGLRVRGMARGERRGRADEYLDLVRMSALAERRVGHLSGGEQQRVALARALAFRPRVLLLDEPLAALDASLRDDLRGELFQLLRNLKVTSLYVTHDQIEAMSLGRELLVMEKGRLAQNGPPEEVYRRPANPFVAGFLGSANLFAGETHDEGGSRFVHLPFGKIPVSGAPLGPCWAMFRPEHVELSHNGEAQFSARVDSVFFLGSQLRVNLRANLGANLRVDSAANLNQGETHILMDGRPGLSLKAQQEVGLRIPESALHVWARDKDGGAQ